jgi:hypothetical protein
LQEVVVDQSMTTSMQEQLEVQEAVELVEEFLELLAAGTPEVVVAVEPQPITLYREEVPVVPGLSS